MAHLFAPPDARTLYDDAPAAVLVAEEPAAGEAAHALEAAGIRVRTCMGFAEAAKGLAGEAALDLIVIEAAGAEDMLFDNVFAEAGALARERPLCVVANVTLEQLDLAAVQLPGARTHILCDAGEGERASALALARVEAANLARGGRALPVMDDARREGEVARLRRVNEEVARIADTLARLTRGDDGDRRGLVRAPAPGYRGPESGGTDASAQEIRGVIRSRRLRDQCFGEGLFADPAWDMLLDLYAAELERRQVSVSSLCIAAAVPPTTALRWIGTLHECGLFERHADPSDRRRAYIGLSTKGVDGMRSYVATVKRMGLPLV